MPKTGRTHAVDPERERALLERGRNLGRILLEAGVGVEPAVSGRIVELDVIDVAVKEDIAGPLEQRARLPLVRPADLPVAQDRGEHATVIQERLGAAERELDDEVGGDAVRP